MQYSKQEQAAAEYLTAFIKQLYSEGKCSFEIGHILEIIPYKKNSYLTGVGRKDG